MTESQYLTAIYAFYFFGPARLKLLLSYFKSAKKIWTSSKDELLEIGLLENEGLHLDELVRISGGKISEISARLTIMEMKGMVKNLGKGMYKRI